MAKSKAKNNGNGATLGFEATLWSAADKMRNNMDAAEYKHVVLGLIFLKYISDAFEEQHAERSPTRGLSRLRPGRSGRIPGRERLLGAAGGPLVAPASQRQAGHESASCGCRNGRHRDATTPG